MTLDEIRSAVADDLRTDNPYFIDQVRRGEQDDGPYMQGALSIWRRFMDGLKPAPEEIEA